MIGSTLGLALLWVAWPHRLRLRAIASHPSLLMLPGLFAASFVYYVSPHVGLAAFATFIVVTSGASLFEHRRSPLLVQESEPRPDVRSVAIAAALVAWLTFRDVAGSGQVASALLGLAAGWLVLLGVYQAVRARALTPSVVLWWSTAFLAVSLIAGGVLGREWIECRYEFGKCTAVGRLYVGIFNSENTLAFFAGLSGTYLLSVRSRRWIPHLMVLVIIVLLTGSRTALAATAMLPLMLTVIRLSSVRSRPDGSFRLAAGAVVSLVLVGPAIGWALVTHASRDTFSLRGELWAEAIAVVSPTSLSGAGRARYDELLDAGLFRGHYPHSQYLLLLFFGGVVALALYSALLSALLFRLRASSRRSLAKAGAPILFTMAYGLTELTWNPVGVDPNLWTVVAMFAVPAASRIRTRPPYELTR